MATDLKLFLPYFASEETSLLRGYGREVGDGFGIGTDARAREMAKRAADAFDSGRPIEMAVAAMEAGEMAEQINMAIARAKVVALAKAVTEAKAKGVVEQVNAAEAVTISDEDVAAIINAEIDRRAIEIAVGMVRSGEIILPMQAEARRVELDRVRGQIQDERASTGATTRAGVIRQEMGYLKRLKGAWNRGWIGMFQDLVWLQNAAGKVVRENAQPAEAVMAATKDGHTGGDAAASSKKTKYSGKSFPELGSPVWVRALDAIAYSGSKRDADEYREAAVHLANAGMDRDEAARTIMAVVEAGANNRQKITVTATAKAVGTGTITLDSARERINGVITEIAAERYAARAQTHLERACLADGFPPADAKEAAARNIGNVVEAGVNLQEMEVVLHAVAAADAGEMHLGNALNAIDGVMAELARAREANAVAAAIETRQNTPTVTGPDLSDPGVQLVLQSLMERLDLSPPVSVESVGVPLAMSPEPAKQSGRVGPDLVGAATGRR